MNMATLNRDCLGEVCAFTPPIQPESQYYLVSVLVSTLHGRKLATSNDDSDCLARCFTVLVRAASLAMLEFHSAIAP